MNKVKLPPYCAAHDCSDNCFVINASDGDKFMLPPVTPPDQIEDGVRYEVLANKSTNERWLRKIGTYIMAEIQGDQYDQEMRYRLHDFPKGYKLYRSYRNKTEEPTRSDCFLYGSKKVRQFASPEEFVPHAIWLAKSGTSLLIDCECKYCGERKQKEITEEMKSRLEFRL